MQEGKKKFDKKTAKFCQSQERTLSLSTRKPENVFQEVRGGGGGGGGKRGEGPAADRALLQADAAMDMAERDFCAASLEYVCRLQALQERKKFELVETLLGFVFGWWTFHHTAHDVHQDAEPRVRDLQLRIQRVSETLAAPPSPLSPLSRSINSPVVFQGPRSTSAAAGRRTPGDSAAVSCVCVRVPSRVASSSHLTNRMPF